MSSSETSQKNKLCLGSSLMESASGQEGPGQERIRHSYEKSDGPDRHAARVREPRVTPGRGAPGGLSPFPELSQVRGAGGVGYYLLAPD